VVNSLKFRHTNIKSVARFSTSIPETAYKLSNAASHFCPRVSILTEINDQPGALHEILKYFWKYDINLTHIESRPNPNKNGQNLFNVYIDFDGKIGEKATDSLLAALKTFSKNTLILDEKECPWFPHHISELDQLSDRTLDAGSDLEADHPGFNDPVYRARRQQLAEISMTHEYGKPVPRVEYTAGNNCFNSNFNLQLI
jgi:phenylalanine-4-hydroxylase